MDIRSMDEFQVNYPSSLKKTQKINKYVLSPTRKAYKTQATTLHYHYTSLLTPINTRRLKF